MIHLIPILMNAYFYGLRLSNIYNLIYLEAFRKALAEGREHGGGEMTSAVNAGTMRSHSQNNWKSTYDSWLKNVDKDLEAELKSEHFISLLSSYTQSLLELRSSFQQMGYPVTTLDRMFDWHVKSRMFFYLRPIF